MGGLHCETNIPRGPRSHEGEPIVATDQENIHLFIYASFIEKIVYFHRQAA